MPTSVEPLQVEPALIKMVLSHAPEAAASWFENGIPSLEDEFARGRFFGTFAGCTRRLRNSTPLDEPEISFLKQAGVPHPKVFDLADIARSALLLRAFRILVPKDAPGLFKESLRKGDSSEQVSSLRALCLIDDPARFLESAIEASRTNVALVFEALAFNSPFPAEHFPDLNFNQLVMKALFMGMPASRICGLEKRVTNELKRMARDYAAERKAADREIPADIALIEAMPA